MERFWCLLAGFAVAIVLVAVYSVVKVVVEDYKEQTERKMRDIAIEEVLKERKYTETLIGVKKHFDEIQSFRKGWGA